MRLSQNFWILPGPGPVLEPGSGVLHRDLPGPELGEEGSLAGEHLVLADCDGGEQDAPNVSLAHLTQHRSHISIFKALTSVVYCWICVKRPKDR